MIINIFFKKKSSNVDNGRDQSDNGERDQFDNNEQDQSDDERSDDDKELKRFDNDEQGRSDNEDEQGRSDDDDDIDIQQKDGRIKFAEDDYESKISNLRSLITHLNQTTIHEIWSVKTIEQNKEHFVILYGSANHLCTCMWLVTRGLVCRHFFSIMFNSDKAMFHIGLIPSRWYNDVTFNPQKEFAITIRSKESETDDKSIYEHQIRTNFDILNEFRNTQLFSETVRANLSHKAKYNLGFGYAKQAIGLALEMGYEDELNTILRNWISEKKRERQPECTSNKENLPSISNPYQTRTKGAPKKRLKNALEDVTKNQHKQNNKQDGFTIQTKYICSYCKGVGYNARSSPEVLSGKEGYSFQPHPDMAHDLALKIYNGLQSKIPFHSTFIHHSNFEESNKELNKYKDNYCIYEFKNNNEIIIQIKEAEEFSTDTTTTTPTNYKTYKTRPQAVYTSRLLDFSNLPKPVNKLNFEKELEELMESFFSYNY
ncbi:hypothetical protein Glove_71g119 [Diversispora epigaea]|uniref:SWIM-type domain-containing protein n=1 Tax=Diversispora epigaea TaxID=1348612 RepID=A0A397JGI2_9GLOM|nr:hypothetical protein Glove_71g119 [Diversispora epigaea]